MSKPKEPETWYPQVIDIMLSEKCSLLQAVSILGVPLTEEEARDHARRRSFRDLYDRMTRSFYESKSSTVSHNKSILVGKMLDMADRLMSVGRLEEASDVLFKAAKVDGMIGPESTTTIFQQLSGGDFSVIKDALKAKQKPESVN